MNKYSGKQSPTIERMLKIVLPIVAGASKARHATDQFYDAIDVDACAQVVYSDCINDYGPAGPTASRLGEYFAGILNGRLRFDQEMAMFHGHKAAIEVYRKLKGQVLFPAGDMEPGMFDEILVKAAAVVVGGIVTYFSGNAAVGMEAYKSVDAVLGVMNERQKQQNIPPNMPQDPDTWLSRKGERDKARLLIRAKIEQELAAARAAMSAATTSALQADLARKKLDASVTGPVGVAMTRSALLKQLSSSKFQAPTGSFTPEKAMKYVAVAAGGMCLVIALAVILWPAAPARPVPGQ